MTSRERAVLAMSGGRPDRVPVVPLIDTSYAAACYGVPVSECFLNPETHARALAGTLARHPGIDGFSVNIGLVPGQIERQSSDGSGLTAHTTDGVEWYIPENDTGTPVRRDVVTLEDTRLRSSASFRPHITETLKRIPADVLEGYDVSAGLTGPFSQIAFILGIERVMAAMMEEPVQLHAAIAARMDFTLDWAEEMVRLNAASVWIGEGFASTSLISPKHYQEFVLPYQRIVCARLRELGAMSVVHICGKATRILDQIGVTGADCFEADWQVDLAEAKVRVGHRMCLKGNLHTTRLIECTPEAIEADASAALAKAAAGGRFILSSGCAVGRDTPPANIDAMVRAAHESGLYA